jgi:transcriptional regulator with XRE-family HTH domain
MKLNVTKVIDARHRKGMNQTQVAKAAGLTIATISKIENGGEVYPDTGKRLCDVLGIDLADCVLSVGDLVEEKNG